MIAYSTNGSISGLFLPLVGVVIMNSNIKKDIIKNIELLFDEIKLLRSQIDSYRERAQVAECRANKLAKELWHLKGYRLCPVRQLKVGDRTVVGGHIRELLMVEFYGESTYRLYFKDGYQVGGCTDEVVPVIHE